MKRMDDLSVEHLHDIAKLMENRKTLRKTRGIMLAVGILIDVVEAGTLIWSIQTGNWWYFAVGMALAIAGAAWVTKFYYERVAYICPECHSVFVPRFWPCLWANHTPRTRRLTCTACGKTSFCLETARTE